MPSSKKKPVILYAEDDYDDFESVKEALQQLSADCELVHARHGEQALEYLRDHEADLPSLVVLDLNMPIMDGKEVLQSMKRDDRYKNIPVMIFTTSSREDDVKLCQKHDCTFFRKPTLYRDLLHIGQVMMQMSES